MDSIKVGGNNKWLYFVIILLLLLLHDNLVLTPFISENKIKLIIFFIFCLLYMKYIYIYRKVNLTRVIYLIGLLFLVFMNMIINQDFTFGYFYIVMLLIIAFITSEIFTFKNFVDTSIKVMVFLTLYSLLCYFLSSLIFKYRTLFYSFTNEADLPFIHLGLAVLVDVEGYYRLFGMFRESGVLQIFLNIAIAMELFLRRDRVRLFHLSVLLVGLILTFSTPGYIAAILIIVAYILFGGKNVIKKREKKTLILGGSLIFFIVLAMYFSNSTFSTGINNAWTKLINKESSYLGRTTSLIVELKLWSEQPVFGYGIQEGFEESKKNGMELLGFYMFNTSTITGLLVTFGGLFTLLLLLMILGFSLRLNANPIGVFLIMIGLLISISSQLMMYNAYFYALLFISIKNIKFWSKDQTLNL